MKIMEIELSEQELCRAVDEYLQRGHGLMLGATKIVETDEYKDGKVIRFRKEGA